MVWFRFSCIVIGSCMSCIRFHSLSNARTCIPASRQRFLFRNEPSAVNLLAWILRGLVMGEGKGNSNLFVAVLTYETGCRD